jgi:hypothetical protein
VAAESITADRDDCCSGELRIPSGYSARSAGCPS